MRDLALHIVCYLNLFQSEKLKISRYSSAFLQSTSPTTKKSTAPVPAPWDAVGIYPPHGKMRDLALHIVCYLNLFQSEKLKISRYSSAFLQSTSPTTKKSTAPVPAPQKRKTWRYIAFIIWIFLVNKPQSLKVKDKKVP